MNSENPQERGGGEAHRLAIKFLNPGAKGPYSDYAWPTPNGGKPGKWVEVKGELKLCRNGIHACTLEESFDWFQEEAYLIELGGRVIDSDDKLCARKGRLVKRLPWDSRTVQLFAADCAERVLPIFEREYPDDDRPRRAIEAARAHARGEIADAAARTAAHADAYAAAHAAYAAAHAAHADAYAAASRAAARAAADAAARAAADAAACAAHADVYAAARAANTAAAAAAYAADAAAAAERKWQLDRLAHHLGLTDEERKEVSA